jgi:hypothetical protein
MLILKHLKTLQHVSIIILIIFRELVKFLVKVTESKILKISNYEGRLWWCSKQVGAFFIFFNINILD